MDRTSADAISTSVLHDLADARNLVVMLDLDGTLMPIAPTPPAQVDAAGRELLYDLSRLQGVQVVLLSGRTRASLAALFPTPSLWLVAEHGAWRRGRDGTFRTAIEGNPSALRRCTEEMEMIAQKYSGAWVEPKSWSVCFHYRLVEPELHAALHADLDTAVLHCLLSAPDYERLNGPASLEVRHRGANKGTAIDWVLEELGGGGARLLVMGDDVTDEDAFRAAGPDDVTVHVGGAETCARYRLSDTEAVRDFLRAFIDERTTASVRGGTIPPTPSLDEAYRPNLVVISNRLPASAPPGARKLNVGGLVSGLAPALTERGGLWVGWSGRAKKGLPVDSGSLQLDLSQVPARGALDLPAETLEHYYDGFCNRTLWPLLHGFFSKVRYEDEEFRAYANVNRAFASAVRSVCPPEAPIWVHDYHLLLAARELRARGHVGRIGFFLHVPLPSVELMETLPWCEEILDAMMDFDLLGFHTERYVDNYLSAQVVLGGATRSGCVVRKGGRESRAAAFPIGISPEPFVGDGSESKDDDEIRNLFQSLGDRRLILGVDRLDYSKGIPERLRAYKAFLETYPEWRRKVALVQVSVPSREALPEYAEQRKLVEELVGHINGEFGEVDWVPVRYLYRSYAQRQLAHLYRTASVGLVTPLRDGMNLVAKEFVASQRADDPGVLLLSKFAGAAEQLKSAYLTNPFHAGGMARDLDACLRMPLEERRERHAALFDVVTRQTASWWSSSFLDALEGACSGVTAEASCTEARWPS
ncbi:MAG: trehalose-phosphatase [Polyangiaceae bacterium]|nr:trehalose-phosphatase [Polyangiaceae bacterium]